MSKGMTKEEKITHLYPKQCSATINMDDIKHCTQQTMKLSYLFIPNVGLLCRYAVAHSMIQQVLRN